MKGFAIAALVLVSACGGSGTEPVVTEAGTYHLMSVNGVLPFVVSNVSGNKHSITNGGLVLDAVNHEFVETLTDVYENPTQTTVGTTTLFGSYTLVGGTLTLHLAASQGGGTIAGQLSGQNISTTDGGRTMIFVKP